MDMAWFGFVAGLDRQLFILALVSSPCAVCITCWNNKWSAQWVQSEVKSGFRQRTMPVSSWWLKVISALQEDATKRQKKHKKCTVVWSCRGLWIQLSFIYIKLYCLCLFCNVYVSKSQQQFLQVVSPSLTPSCLYITLNGIIGYYKSLL